MLKRIPSVFLLYKAFVLALLGMVGSLFFSEVLGYPPCNLCWYQRITLYPLVLILGIGIWWNDKKVWVYALPLTIIGSFIALYHNLLDFGIIPSTLAPCGQGVSCLIQNIRWLGFITIPFMSLVAHLVILACLVLYRQKELKSA